MLKDATQTGIAALAAPAAAAGQAKPTIPNWAWPSTAFFLVLAQIFLKLAQQKQATACLNIYGLWPRPKPAKAIGSEQKT